MTVPRIAKAPRNPPVDGWMLARPFASEVTKACDIPRIIGIGSLVIVVSPPDTIGALLVVRPSNDWNSTLTPSTGSGGVEVSVTRTVIG